MPTERKKICIIMGGHWETGRGGAQYQVKCLLDRLINEDDFDVFYVARGLNGVSSTAGYQLVNISKGGVLGRYGMFFDAFRLNRILETIQPDAIYQRGLKSYVGIAARYANAHGVKQVFHIAHDYDVIPSRHHSISLEKGFRPLALIERKLGEYGVYKSSRIIAQTEAQAEYLRKYHGRQADAVIRNFHPLPTENIVKSEERIKVIWVANLKPFKRPEIFIRLANDLRHLKHVDFLMIGHESEEKEYTSQVTGSEMPNFHYLGEQPIEEVNCRLAEGDIFVNTSVAEGFPNTFIQAWMREVPVVSYGVDVDNALKEERAGYCCDSYEELRKRVVELVENKEKRTALGRKAKELAYSDYSMKNVEELIRQIRACL